MSAVLRDPLWDEHALALIDDGAGGALLFEHPVGAIEATHPHDVRDAFRALEAARRAGRHLAGFFSYELGYALEPRLFRLMPEGRRSPLLSFGIFDAPRSLNACELNAFLAKRARDTEDDPVLAPPSIDETSYTERFDKVQAYLRAGDAYQVNLTFALHVTFPGDPLALYRRLRRSARSRHGAYLALADRHILSLSPELFIEGDGTRLATRPMKGTAPRAPRLEDDDALRRALRHDPKNRAENLMIVDLLRNDLGRVARVGSVEVVAQNEIETYPTLHQMTSTIAAQLRPDSRFADIVAALFPCGSVTGAPKIRAMEIIHELEDGPRGLYCGAIGHLAPPTGGNTFAFNVAIRTLELDRAGLGTLNVGSGIVADSSASGEYAECLLKARFMTDSTHSFELFETMLWERDGGYVLGPEHLARLSESARYFDFPFDAAQARARLEEAAARFAEPRQRVRLVLAEAGEITLSAAPLPGTQTGPWKLALSPERVDSNDPFLYHKTTRRPLYAREHARLAKLCGADEVVFQNTRGEITEGSFTNIFVARGDALLTPPVACGLLPGTLRAKLLAEDRCREATLTVDDLARAQTLYVGNSVRGLVPCTWIG